MKQRYELCPTERVFANLHGWRSPVASFRVRQLCRHLPLLLLRGVCGVNWRWDLGQDVIHGGVHLLAVDGVLGHRVADAKPSGPQRTPDVLMQLPQTELGQAHSLK